MLLLIKKHTDTLIEQTKTKPQETLDFKMWKQVVKFSFNPPITSVNEWKWLFGVTFFEATNFVFDKNNENNFFSITTPSFWSARGGAETIHKLQNLIEHRSQSHLELHVEKFRKRGNQIKIEDKEDKISDPDTHKKGNNWKS